MAQAPRSFRRAAKKQTDRPVVAFTLDWLEDLTDEQIAAGEEPEVIRSDTFHATKPTDERLFLVAALIGDEDAVGSEATAVIELFRDCLPTSEYRTLKDRLGDPNDSVDLDVLQEITGWLLEEWTSFPTEPSSGSSTSRTNTGPKSTGRAPGKGSTRSTSPSIAS
jgi:hypothetical protein